jgi:hypothetical protein
MPAQRRSAPRPSQFRPHPWHGLVTGPKPPGLLYAFIEITLFDLVIRNGRRAGREWPVGDPLP